MYHTIRGKDLAKHVRIHIKSELHESKYPWDEAQKHLGRNAIILSRKYNVELENIRIGHISVIPSILVLILYLLVRGTVFSFHADIYTNAGAPLYFHPSPMQNGIPSAPWGYLSHDPHPTSHGKDSLMEPYPNALYGGYDAYRSTLAGVNAVV